MSERVKTTYNFFNHNCCSKVEVDWSDEHTSCYQSDWLAARSFDEKTFSKRYSMAKGPAKILWGSEHATDIKYHNFKDVTNDDRALFSWLHGNTILNAFAECSIIYQIIVSSF